MDGEMISAADIEKYGYCPLSWWLSRGRKSEQETVPEKTGIIEHGRILEEIEEMREKEQGAKTSEKIVLWFAVVATIIAFTGISVLKLNLSIKFSQIMGFIAIIWISAAFFFLYKSTTSKDEMSVKYGQIVIIFAIIAMVIAINAVLVNFLSFQHTEILVIIALLWLVASTIFLYNSMRMSKKARQIREKHHVKGTVLYADNEAQGKTELFVSEKHGIRGRPDYVIEVEGEIIPVDIKTGRTPRGPLFSHILQVGTYCILIEDKYGRTPPYGLLKYGDNLHEIDFDNELKNLVLEKVSRMRDAIQTGNVHRNHSRVGKCRTCSKRDGCPERLA